MNPSKFQKTEMGATSKNVHYAYIQPGALSRGRGHNFGSLGSIKTSIGKRTLVGESKNHNSTAFEQNKFAYTNTLVPPGFASMEDHAPLAQDTEAMQETGIALKNVNLAFIQPAALARGRGKSFRSLGSAKDKFDSDDTNHQREHVLNHMRQLWNNWRGSLHKYVKLKPLHEALKDVSEEVDKSDWEWLVKEHFLSEKFKEASIRNSINRSKLRMPHRTGSKPIREIIYELGGKDGNPPNMATIFFETHKKNDTLVEPEASKKYDEIQELVQSEPSLTNIEVVERCFGPQNKSHVVGLGGGITTKELKGGSSSKAAILAELNATRKEKESLQTELNATKKAKELLEIRMGNIDSKYEHIISLLVDQPSSAPSSSQQSTS
ncbi:hypothetical protein A4A49_01612 [Nicotiana attenuata]|uniref:Transposase, Ptta/En/Spm, plant n=1 Tax=Nicotiana attenuata TaxID=49451 RepID=A0A1J6I1I6_NICAT|nr:hypothetical protein A4A49_01612 [Nicotiana attenuata]